MVLVFSGLDTKGVIQMGGVYHFSSVTPAVFWPLKNSRQYLQHCEVGDLCLLWHLTSWIQDFLRLGRPAEIGIKTQLSTNKMFSLLKGFFRADLFLAAVGDEFFNTIVC